MFERASLARVLPFAIYMAFIFIADMLDHAGVPALELRWLYGVKIVAVLAALLYFRREYSELAWPPRLSASAWSLATACGVLVLVLWINLNAEWMSVGKPSGFDPQHDGGIDWRLAAMRLAGGALAVPVMEELFWRSFLLRWLVSHDFLAVRPAMISTLPLLVTAVVFGVEHNLWLAGMVAGVVYGGLYWRSGNLWSPIWAHVVTNGLLGTWILLTGQWTYW